MHPAVYDDRIWFNNNPSAVVRFRRAVTGEFQAVTNRGLEPPVFRPSFCRSEATVSWVAVVNLIRLVGIEKEKPQEPTARLRLRIPALRSLDRQRRAEQELKQAIAAELLASLETQHGEVAA